MRATTGTAIHAALCGRAADSTPIVIEVEGTINHGNTSKVSGTSCNTADGVIELKQISNVTIVGVGGGAVFDQIGIHIRESSNIIIQNVTVKNVKKSGSPTSNGGDAIGMESGVRNVWVDHTTLEASGGESEGYDGLFDMKADTRYVTLSYSILRNSGRGGLVGSSESDVSNGFVTYHHNLYENIDSRAPLLRGGVGHMFNNHYVRINSSGINSRAGARAKVENNYFEDSKDVLGTFYTDAAGYWQADGNTLDNVTWSSPGEDNNPAGPAMESTTTVSIPYAYSADAAGCVPDVVSRTAGAGKGLKVSDGNCTVQPPTEPTPGPTDPTPGPPIPRRGPPIPRRPAGPTSASAPDPTDPARHPGPASATCGTVTSPPTGRPPVSTGHASIKWDSATAVSSVVIREAAGSVGSIGAWRLRDADAGTVLASGDGAGTISFPRTTLRKITFEIVDSTGSPRIAEFETYAG